MIFITEKYPTFRGYINGVNEREMPNGGKAKSFKIGTRETKQDGTKVYSNWWFSTIGEAHKKEDQLTEGAFVTVTAFKMTNVSKKNDDGTWEKPYFRMQVSDFTVSGGNNSEAPSKDDEDVF